MAGLYIHIPFCSSKCPYCNFFSLASLKYRDGFSAVLAEEMRLRATFLEGQPLQTLYFGGGTPSLLMPEELGMLIRRAGELFDISLLGEITIEANPEHVNSAWLQGIREAGITRISLGVQSLHDEALRELGRSHSAALAEEALHLCIESDIPEISADLIFGMHSLSDEMLAEDLRFFCHPRIGHLSSYALTVEENTALSRTIAKELCPPPDEEKLARQMGMVMETLSRSGFEQYEISNYCRPGKESKHNSSYWNGTPYLGLGPSAHSYNGTSRSWNVNRIEAYINGIRGAEPVFEMEVLTPVQKFNEYIMTSLRTRDGIDTEKAGREFGAGMLKHLQDQAERYIRRDLIVEKNGRLRLSDTGRLLADGITASLFADE